MGMCEHEKFSLGKFWKVVARDGSDSALDYENKDKIVFLLNLEVSESHR